MSHNLCNLNTLPYEKMDFLTIDIGHLRGSGNELQKTRQEGKHRAQRR